MTKQEIIEKLRGMAKFPTVTLPRDSEALRKAADLLEEQEQGEPVAWIEHHKGGDNLNWEQVNHPYSKATPLYTTQQQRKPLTDEQFQAIRSSLSRQEGWDGDGWDLALKEAIEAAHQIKE
jgi:hypothetical protein